MFVNYLTIVLRLKPVLKKLPINSRLTYAHATRLHFIFSLCLSEIHWYIPKKKAKCTQRITRCCLIILPGNITLLR